MLQIFIPAGLVGVWRLGSAFNTSCYYHEVMGRDEQIYLSPLSEPIGGCWGGGGTDSTGSDTDAGQQRH